MNYFLVSIHPEEIRHWLSDFKWKWWNGMHISVQHQEQESVHTNCEVKRLQQQTIEWYQRALRSFTSRWRVNNKKIVYCLKVTRWMIFQSPQHFNHFECVVLIYKAMHASQTTGAGFFMRCALYQVNGYSLSILKATHSIRHSKNRMSYY